MMNEQISLMYNYNIWANERVLNHLKSLPGDIFHKEVELGFKSVAEVIGHIIAADEVWISRINGESPVAVISKQFSNVEEASHYFNKLQSQIRECLLSTNDMERKVTYKSTLGEEFQNSITEIIQHVVNHGTYHRGNISSILRCLGYSGIQTDYIAYLRIL